jgi:hypothetical protein
VLGQGQRNTYARNTGAGLRVIAIAALRLSRCDICEAARGVKVDERVYESESGFAGAETSVVEECNDGCSDG